MSSAKELHFPGYASIEYCNSTSLENAAPALADLSVLSLEAWVGITGVSHLHEEGISHCMNGRQAGNLAFITFISPNVQVIADLQANMMLKACLKH